MFNTAWYRYARESILSYNSLHVGVLLLCKMLVQAMADHIVGFSTALTVWIIMYQCPCAFPLCTMSMYISSLYHAYGHFPVPIVLFFEAQYTFVTYRPVFLCEPPVRTRSTCWHIHWLDCMTDLTQILSVAHQILFLDASDKAHLFNSI